MSAADDAPRIIQPEALAEALCVDTSRESQLAIAERIIAAMRRHGPLATKKQGDDGEVFVGPLNDYTLAEIAAIPLRGRLVLDRAGGSFYAFDEPSGIFKKMTREEAGRCLNVVYANLPALSQMLNSLGCRPCSVRMMRSLLEAMSATASEDYPFGGDPDSRSAIISRPVANGLLRFNLISGEVEFRPGLEPSDRALHRAPVCYDPGAGAVPSRMVGELLAPALGSAEMAEEFLDDMTAAWLGGSLWAGVLCLIGASDAGKSQLVEMLRRLHGKPHWCALSSRSVAEKFGSSFLSGPVRVVSFTDAKGTALTGDTGALIKALTGGDVVEDRGPHAQLLVSIPGDKVFVLVSNSPPKIDFEEDVDAWVRRVRPYRFQSYHVERRVSDFAKVLLLNEGSGILNRLIEGATRRMQLMIAGKRPEMNRPWSMF